MHGTYPWMLEASDFPRERSCDCLVTPADAEQFRFSNVLLRNHLPNPLESRVDPGLKRRLAQIAQSAGDDDEVVVCRVRQVAVLLHRPVCVNDRIGYLSQNVVPEGQDHAPMFRLVDLIGFDDSDPEVVCLRK